MPDSRQTASRLGPSHCGQSSAMMVVARQVARMSALCIKLRCAKNETGAAVCRFSLRLDHRAGFEQRFLDEEFFVEGDGEFAFAADAGGEIGDVRDVAVVS